MFVHLCVYLTDVKDDNGNSPLDVAVRENELDTALYLINHYYNNDEDKGKVFIKACLSGELKVVKGLVEQCSVDPQGISLFHV